MVIIQINQFPVFDNKPDKCWFQHHLRMCLMRVRGWAWHGYWPGPQLLGPRVAGWSHAGGRVFITLSRRVSVWLSAFPATVVQSVKFVFSLFQRFTVAIGFVCICWMYYLNGILCSTDYNYNWFCCICWMFYFKRFMSVVVSLSLTLLPLWFVLSGKVYFLLLVVWW